MRVKTPAQIAKSLGISPTESNNPSVAAKELGVKVIEIPLKKNPRNRNRSEKWLNPRTGHWSSVEHAILGCFEIDGWRGSWNEDGLLLNLIKAMSFPCMSLQLRVHPISSLYAPKGYYKDTTLEDDFDLDWLLNNVRVATREQVKDNVEKMFSREKYTWTINGEESGRSTTDSLADFYPTLEKWAFLELYDAIKLQKLYEITKVFIENPLVYSSGWSDLIIWKDEKVIFVEVKAPADKLRLSQKINISKFIKPLNLEYWLVSVVEIEP